MQQFQDFVTPDLVVAHLCRIRAQIARRRSKKQVLHALSHDPKHNHHEEANFFSAYEQEIIKQLNELLPSRRKWLSLGEKPRQPAANDAKHNSKRLRYRLEKGQRVKRTSYDCNLMALQKTVKHYIQYHPEEPFVQKLVTFIDDLRTAMVNGSYNVGTPDVIPSPKDDPRLVARPECRPIALFELRDRVVLSITNRYLTKLLDPYFLDCSFAFRALRTVGPTKGLLTHHDAFQQIKDFRELHSHEDIWVAECDIMKFFDSVSHKVVRNRYAALIQKVKSDHPNLSVEAVTALFNSYLSCFAFNTQVYPKNHDRAYWEADPRRPKNGFFGWIEEDLIRAGHSVDPNVSRIGVPQGGALSGLIANIVLHGVDLTVANAGDGLYIRFCDDMVILSTEQSTCLHMLGAYTKAIEEVQLVPHEIADPDRIGAFHSNARVTELKRPTWRSRFWKEKSKGPYRWGTELGIDFPWIGFVGYELHREGSTRVRRKSLKKERKKQHKVIRQIRKACGIHRRPKRIDGDETSSADLVALGRGKQELKKARNGAILSSAISSLISMSVGRLELWNSALATGEMSWKNGFRKLGASDYVARQMRSLDRSRNKLYYDLESDLKSLEDNAPADVELDREPVDYDAPFSYHYQVVTRNRDGSAPSQ